MAGIYIIYGYIILSLVTVLIGWWNGEKMSVGEGAIYLVLLGIAQGIVKLLEGAG